VTHSADLVELPQPAGARRRGIVAKLKAGRYTPEETSWVKIKNASYNQVMGRDKLVKMRLGASA
jgi:hypothetical protein